MFDVNWFAAFFDPEYGDGWFPGLMVMMLSGYVAAPAIASIALVEAQKRWPLFQRSIVAAAVFAVAATFIVGGLWIGSVASVAEDYAQHKMLYRTLPYLALAAVAIAVVFQLSNRATFSRPRAVAIACAALLPIIILIAGRPS